jgi:hypothetical protein
MRIKLTYSTTCAECQNQRGNCQDSRPQQQANHRKMIGQKADNSRCMLEVCCELVGTLSITEMHAICIYNYNNNNNPWRYSSDEPWPAEQPPLAVFPD